MHGDCGCYGAGWGHESGPGAGLGRGYGRASRRGRGSWGPAWGFEEGPGYGWHLGGPTKTERREWLEALKKHLEERLAEVEEELTKT